VARVKDCIANVAAGAVIRWRQCITAHTCVWSNISISNSKNSNMQMHRACLAYLGDRVGLGLGEPGELNTATTVTALSSCSVATASGNDGNSRPSVALYSSQRRKVVPGGASAVSVYVPGATRPAMPHRPSPGCCSVALAPTCGAGCLTQLLLALAALTLALPPL
jgi:hypothetical protein